MPNNNGLTHHKCQKSTAAISRNGNNIMAVTRGGLGSNENLRISNYSPGVAYARVGRHPSNAKEFYAFGLSVVGEVSDSQLKENKMLVSFRTNIDAAQPYMANLKAKIQDSTLQVGDRVNITNLPNKAIQMVIASRSIELITRGTPEGGFDSKGIWVQHTEQVPMLVYYLDLTSFWSQSGLEKFEEALKK